jgi:hypothetical protein
MKLTKLFLFLSVATIACKSKNDPIDVKPAALTTHYFSGKYQMYDSSYHYMSTAVPGLQFDTSLTVSYTVNVFMDSTANYIVSKGDTFKYDETYKTYGLSGYYHGTATPNGYYQIILSTDSVKYIKKFIPAGHSYAHYITQGYRVP